APRRHPEYYFDDGNLVVLVGTVLFRLWDSTFRRHATAFPLDKAPDDAHPLVLPGVAAADFERLLWVIYPPWARLFSSSDASKCESADPAKCQAANAHALGAPQKIALAQRYAVPPEWAAGAYATLCARAEALDQAEGRLLGIETVVRVAGAR
ncbi:hypothetical protein B0H17DRAFT_853235, partial [Mycena rosella]